MHTPTTTVDSEGDDVDDEVQHITMISKRTCPTTVSNFAQIFGCINNSEQPDNAPKRLRPAVFISPGELFSTALRGQESQSDVREMTQYCKFKYIILLYLLLTWYTVTVKTEPCMFYKIPEALYDPDGLPDVAFSLGDDDIIEHPGTLKININSNYMQRGTFKTAHPGSVCLDSGALLPPFTSGKVCVKQLYEKGNHGGIGRMKGRHELQRLSDECNTLRWASILLDLTYQFIAREIKTRGQPIYPIPELRFTSVMIAIVQNPEKAYLVEEWIDTEYDKVPFTKYINNNSAESLVPSSAPEAAHDTANFLVFAQHVQWEKTNFAAFTSDYQGAGALLTDPQIISNPHVLPVSFFSKSTDIFHQQPQPWQKVVWARKPSLHVQGLPHNPPMQLLLQVLWIETQWSLQPSISISFGWE
jgi:hypothetical protein